jgi:hypothetical protein
MGKGGDGGTGDGDGCDQAHGDQIRVSRPMQKALEVAENIHGDDTNEDR